MPAPSEFLAAGPRASSYVPADLRKEAEDFPPALPNQRAAATAGGAVFSPDWQPGDTVDKLAYAAYAFDIPGYDLNDELKFGWLDPPAQGQLWIALADWDKNRWKWFKPAGDSLTVPLGSIEPFFTFGGDLLVVVLLTGREDCELDWLRVGNAPPVVSIVCTGPTSGLAPLSTSFDASASFDPDGTIVKYDWDWDGNGSFDNTTGSNPLAQHSFSDVGEFNVAVRATDNTGGRAQASTAVEVLAGWQHSIGGAENEEIFSVAAGPDGSVWACGRVVGFTPGNPVNEVLLLKFSAAGELLHEVRWAADTAETSYYLASDMAIDPADGRVYLIGNIIRTGQVGHLFQRWSPEAVLENCSLVNNDQSYFSKLVIGGDKIYLGGRHDGALGMYYGAWLELTKTGEAGAGGYVEMKSIFNDLAYATPLAFPDVPRLHLCGFRSSFNIDFPEMEQDDAFYCSVPLDGSAVTAMSWGMPTTNQQANWLRYSTHGVNTRIDIGLQIVDSSPSGSFAAVSRIGDSSVSGYTLNNNINLGGGAGFGSGFLLAGTTTAAQGALLQLDVNRQIFAAFTHSGSAKPGCSALHSSGLLILGGAASNANGIFELVANPSANVEELAWTANVVTRGSFAGLSSVLATDNASVRPPGVLDSGGGGVGDAWVSLFQPAE